MKALVYTDKEKLRCKEVPDPVAETGGVVMRISNCGICGSDIFLYKSGGLPDGAIMGHELSGTIEAIGPRVEGIRVGDRVIARPAGCGTCRWCLEGKENLCARRRSIGLGKRPGGFAEFMAADADMILPVPENLGLDQASMADQFGSALHGMKVANFMKGENALVVGAGPIGLCAVMLLRHAGASKIVVSESLAGRSAVAIEFGADAAESPEILSLAATIAKHFKEGPDCIFECSGTVAGTQAAIQCAPTGCRIVFVGMCTKPVTFLPFTLFQKHLAIFGSFGNTQAECRECMDVMASGSIPSARLITKKVALEQLPDAFEEAMQSKEQLKIMMER